MGGWREREGKIEQSVFVSPSVLVILQQPNRNLCVAAECKAHKKGEQLKRLHSVFEKHRLQFVSLQLCNLWVCGLCVCGGGVHLVKQREDAART